MVHFKLCFYIIEFKKTKSAISVAQIQKKKKMKQKKKKKSIKSLNDTKNKMNCKISRSV